MAFYNSAWFWLIIFSIIVLIIGIALYVYYRTTTPFPNWVYFVIGIGFVLALIGVIGAIFWGSTTPTPVVVAAVAEAPKEVVTKEVTVRPVAPQLDACGRPMVPPSTTTTTTSVSTPVVANAVTTTPPVTTVTTPPVAAAVVPQTVIPPQAMVQPQLIYTQSQIPGSFAMTPPQSFFVAPQVGAPLVAPQMQMGFPTTTGFAAEYPVYQAQPPLQPSSFVSTSF